MTISELIDTLQKLEREHGDLEMLFENNGCLADVKSVDYMQKYSLPPVFVISDRAFIDIRHNEKHGP